MVNKDKPDWHSEESWRIETLDWLGKEEDFNLLVDYARSVIGNELSEQGRKLEDVVGADELRSEIRLAAESYGEKYKKIGMASHITLWTRAFVISKLKGQKWR